jgi:ABC-type sulfate transport system substrate-binding protein
MFKFGRFSRLTVGFALLSGVVAIGSAVAQTSLLNASYDPTRELYKDYNAAFTKHWQAIKDWGDLAAWAGALKQPGGNEEKANELVTGSFDQIYLKN